jgi:hypothetical protein
LSLALLFCGRVCEGAPEPAGTRPVPPELLQRSFLFEIARHLYRWHLDESDIERIAQAKQFTIWVRGLEPKLDPDDHSQFGEVLFPQLNLSVKVKKADYRIEELNQIVRTPGFKVTQLTRGQVPPRRPESCQSFEVDMKEMRDYLFRTRNQREVRGEALTQRLREAVRKQAAKDNVAAPLPGSGDQIGYIAPLSPVANEVWAFWETGRKLFYFASDVDLANPAVWENQSLTVRIYDLEQQVVVSREEAPGSNRFLTRYQAGRALFNCLVLGDRVVFSPGQR